MLYVFCVVLGAAGSIILSVTDGGCGFGGDSSCGGGSSGGSSYVLLTLFYLLVCSLRAREGDSCLLIFLPFVHN
jgi:hypothetical protein